jgi:restriction system protein
VPTYDRFIEPILRYLTKHPDGAAARDAHEAAATALGLSQADKQELLPSGVQPVYKNRAGWAHDRLKRAGLSESLRRGFWRLTAEGCAFAKEHPAPLSADDLDELATGHMDVRLRDTEAPTLTPEGGSAVPVEASRTASPDDRLEQALAELPSLPIWMRQ